jgi:hypothetical protein
LDSLRKKCRFPTELLYQQFQQEGTFARRRNLWDMPTEERWVNLFVNMVQEGELDTSRRLCEVSSNHYGWWAVTVVGSFWVRWLGHGNFANCIPPEASRADNNATESSAGMEAGPFWSHSPTREHPCLECCINAVSSSEVGGLPCFGMTICMVKVELL